MTALDSLPTNLPVPIDDGACDHLTGMIMPPLSLTNTMGQMIDLSILKNRYVLYFYPMTGLPGVALPENWDALPGARGCTPQACAFRDHAQELAKHNTQIYGISSQTSAYQSEAKNRLHLPFDLLSDQHLSLKQHLNLPTFNVDSLILYKRLTLIIENRQIKKVFYPVFPPNKNAQLVLNWLDQHH